MANALESLGIHRSGMLTAFQAVATHIPRHLMGAQYGAHGTEAASAVCSRGVFIYSNYTLSELRRLPTCHLFSYPRGAGRR